MGVENAYEHSRRSRFRKVLKPALFEDLRSMFSGEEREETLRRARGDFNTYDVFRMQQAAEDILKDPRLSAKERALLQRIRSEDPKSAKKYVALLERKSPQIFGLLRIWAAERYGGGRITTARYYNGEKYVAGTEFADRGSAIHELTHLKYDKMGMSAKTVDEPLAYAVEDAITRRDKQFSEFSKLMENDYYVYRANLAAANYKILRSVAAKIGPRAALAVSRQLNSFEKLNSKVRKTRVSTQDKLYIFKQQKMGRLLRWLRKMKR